MSFVVNNRFGGKSVLLNPSEKGKKYAIEMKNKIHLTNNGEVKLNKYGQPRTLSKEAKAYRAGYLQARKDNAKCYNAQQKKKGFFPLIVFKNHNN